MMAVDVSVSREAGDWPDKAEWLAERAALCALGAAYEGGAAEMSVVLADDTLVQRLNRDYRGKDKPTNVLSFALTESEDPELGPELGEDAPVMLGDVVLAWETVRREAAEQDKTAEDHLTHLVIHGVLHLLGYDHIEDAEAEEMERLETRLLDSLGITDPYAGPRTGAGHPINDEPPER